MTVAREKGSSGTNDSFISKAAAPTVSLILSFAVDRLAKSWALANLPYHSSVPFIPGFLRFTLTSNKGAAFSLGHDNAFFMTALASLLTALLIFWVVSRVARNEKVPTLELAGIGTLIGGSLGNLYDRFTLGRVTDFLEFDFMAFPVFNPADVFIDIGLGLLLISRFRHRKDAEAAGDASVVNKLR